MEGVYWSMKAFKTSQRYGAIMLRIGTFSRFSQVPVKTLRYYDEIGLLKPNHVDSFTGYRYYSFDQLSRLNRIVALKDLGLTLDHIAQMLEADLSTDEIRGMLRLKQTQLEEQMREAQEQLVRVEARLKLIDTEGKMPAYDAVIKTVESQQVAFIREIIPTQDKVGPILDRNFDGVANYIAEHGAKIAGPGIAIWHDDGPKDTNMDVEAALPIDRPLTGNNSVKIYELPEEQMACVIYRGNFSGFPQAYEAVVTWIKSNGYRIIGSNREVYLQHDRSAPDNSVTEIQFPVEKT